MTRVLVAFLFTVLFSAGSGQAQQGGNDGVWVQIEAHPSLRVAQQRAQQYSDLLADVGGFSLGGSWYGIVLGPYARADAERVLQVYRAEGQIPADSFIAFSGSLGQQFWPVGANLANRTPAAPTLPETETETEVVQIQPSDETPAEARQSERLLSADERKELQIALAAAGFYNSTIDGAFGRGTRASMAAWQGANGYEDTGVLTTLQRRALMDQYNAPLISVGMARRFDNRAGIEIDLPLGAVEFDRYEPPFAHYASRGDLGVRVLLISQPGGQATLQGLYDIMQTLEIVPLDGPRQRDGDSFTLEGRGNGIVSYTQAALAGGEIKGFTLVWPDGDEDRRNRVLSAMQASFSRTEGVLDAATGDGSVQSVDLVSGLEIRKPRLSRSGFFVDEQGTVVTVAEAVGACTRVTLDYDHTAQVVSQDAGLGVAVLRPVEPLAPMVIAELGQGEPRLQADVTVSGYSYQGILGAPTLTFGKLSDVKGLRGETELARLALAPQDGDAGGPVFDAGGSVVGMLLPDPGTGQQLPRDVSFAADAQALREVLEAAGLAARSIVPGGAISPDELSRRASGMTVLVSCWD